MRRPRCLAVPGFLMTEYVGNQGKSATRVDSGPALGYASQKKKGFDIYTSDRYNFF